MVRTRSLVASSVRDGEDPRFGFPGPATWVALSQVAGRGEAACGGVSWICCDLWKTVGASDKLPALTRPKNAANSSLFDEHSFNRICSKESGALDRVPRQR